MDTSVMFGGILDLSSPVVMGILNATPDSFSDGGCYGSIELAVRQAILMAEDGASIVDIGGESTRPGAAAVTVQQELDRVVPVIEVLVAEKQFNLPISIDTSKPEVMRQAVRAGALLVNDVRALQEPGAVQALADLQVPVCLMHMQGQPRTMQKSPKYDAVLNDVARFLRERIMVCESAGIKIQNILLDPGFGFGKGLDHNLHLLKHLDKLSNLDCPLLVGISRKSIFDQLLALPVDQRKGVSVVAAVLAAQNGAQILRVHDVKETVEGLKLLKAVQSAADC